MAKWRMQNAELDHGGYGLARIKGLSDLRPSCHPWLNFAECRSPSASPNSRNSETQIRGRGAPNCGLGASRFGFRRPCGTHDLVLMGFQGRCPWLISWVPAGRSIAEPSKCGIGEGLGSGGLGVMRLVRASSIFLATDETPVLRSPAEGGEVGRMGRGRKKGLKLGRRGTPPSGPTDGRAPTNSCIATRYEMP